MVPTRRTFLIQMAAASAAVTTGVGAASKTTQPRTAATEPRGRLLVTIDCTKDFSPEKFFANGPTRVVETAAGRYREADVKPSARFGYRFAIEHIGRPHVAVIRYPDDKRRYMCIMDGTCYDLSTGVFTNWAQPLSGRMLELHQVFWPRWKDCSITFLTWGQGESAAVASIEIYELDGLPPLRVTGDPGDGSHREIGIQYEDPCGTGASEGAMTRSEWIERLVTYARHSGQNLLVYPLVWYHGPQFPSTREPADGFDIIVGADRKQYVRWTTHPADWYAELLERFGREGLAFQGSLTLLRLGSLLKNMNVDLDAIKGGADTFNNMLWNNQVQASPQDWTLQYNARNFTAIVEGKIKTTGWAYGEKPGGPYPPGPMFNPLHPTVPEAVIGLAKEIAERYARFPAFKGISFNFWHATILWFASLHSGYDDYTTGLFQKETGIQVPVDAKSPERFGKRYEHLNFHCQPAWIEWRCRKIRELIRRIRDVVVAARPDLRVTLTIWDETTVPQLLGWASAATQLYARPTTAELYRNGGLDFRLYENEPGIELDLGCGNSRDRGGHPPHPTDGVNTPIECACMYRDHDFLDAGTLNAMASQPRPGAFIFNCWVESWGEHKWFAADPGDRQAKELAVMDGKPAEGIFRINSIYPPDGFWWDSQLRITPAFPGGVHFLEPYAHAVAEFDALRVTRGGLFLDKAHTEELRRFAAAYRALPRVKFETVGSTTDPVVARTLLHSGQRYCYLVNRDYYPVRVALEFTHSPGKVQDLGKGETLRASHHWEITLGPYELRSFALARHVGLAGFTPKVPTDIAEALLADGRQALRDLDAARATGWLIPGTAEMRDGIERAIAGQRLAWLRRALTSYIVRKCREIKTGKD
jgi:hypothetical protein